MKAVEVTITHGHVYHMYIRFRDEIDIKHPYWGRTYKDPELASMRRLARVLSTMPCEVSIDGMTPFYTFRREVLP